MGANLTDNDLENEKNIKRFVIRKYIIDLIMLVAILSAIIICRANAFIENGVTGTLLGAAIGYFAKDIKKIHT